MNQVNNKSSITLKEMVRIVTEEEKQHNKPFRWKPKLETKQPEKPEEPQTPLPDYTTEQYILARQGASEEERKKNGSVPMCSYLRNMCSIVDKNDKDISPSPVQQEMTPTGIAPLPAQLPAQPPALTGVVLDQVIGNAHFCFVNGMLYKDNQEFMNANVDIREIIQKKNSVELVCDVHVEGKCYRKVVDKGKFTDPGWIIGIPNFYNCCNSKTKFNEAFYTYANSLIRSSSHIQVHKLFTTPGWHILENGQHAYVTPSGAIGYPNGYCRSEYGQKIPVSNPLRQDYIARFLSLFQLTRNEAASAATILLLYTVQSTCYHLFKEAGFPPKYIIYLQGRTNCFKTTIALALTQFENRTTPKYMMKSTAAGLESGFREYVDAVMLIDDLPPLDDSYERKRLEENLELITRNYGDATGKTRNYDFQDKPMEQYKSEGGAIITAEYLTGKQSSRSRYVVLELRQGDVDPDFLWEVSKDVTYISDFIVCFMTYIGKNYPDFVEYIRSQCERLRSELGSRYSHARFAEYHAQLLCTADLICSFIGHTGHYTQQQLEAIYAEMRGCIEVTLQRNQQNLEKFGMQTETLLCNAIPWWIARHPDRILSVKHYKHEANIIFEDEQFYYLEASHLKGVFDEYCKAHGYKGEYTAASLARKLVHLGVAAEFEEGNTKRYNTKLPKHGNTRYVRLDKNALLQNVHPE